MGRKLIFLEFNEICPPLLDRWMAAGELPNFRRFYEDSEVFTTVTDVDSGPHLEPWVQWYSLHTGIRTERHRVFNLTDGTRAAHEDVWGILRRHNLRVMNCSSMNARAFEGDGNFYMPDPWCNSQMPFPEEVNRFYRVVSHQVRQYTSRDSGLGLREYLSFLRFLIGHGLGFKTVRAVLGQLAGERFSRGKTSWKRVSLLDRMQADVFRHYWRELQPDFATFFVNSTAHYQHAYWRCMDPEPFVVKPSDAERRRYGGAVLHGYRQMDALLADFFRLERAGATLVLASAMSQQPFLRCESTGGQRFFRPHKVEALLARLEIRPERIEPVMTHQFVVHFADDAGAEHARRTLREARMDGQAVFGLDPAATGRKILFDCCVHHEVPEGSVVTLPGDPPRTLRFSEQFYMIDAMKSGKHHPEGVLWFKRGHHRLHQERVSVLDILPTILSAFGLPKSAASEAEVSSKAIDGLFDPAREAVPA